MSNWSESWLEDMEVSLAGFKRLIVAYSGGKDSHVLLHLLSRSERLKPKLRALHVNHGLSEYAKAWEHHCLEVCEALAIPLISHTVDARPQQGESPEEAARNARYQAFNSLPFDNNDCFLMAHHQNDQAETLLLQLFRGAGLAGLAAMPVWSELASGMKACRPLLNQPQARIDDYAKQHALSWVEDASNRDLRFDRNFLRHQIVPLLQQRWPSVASNISRSADHCAEAMLILDQSVETRHADAIDASGRLVLDALAILEPAEQRLLLRHWLKKCHIKPPNARKLAVIRQQCLEASDDAMPVISWDNREVRRYRGHLYAMQALAKSDTAEAIPWRSWPNTLILDDSSRLVATAVAKEEGMALLQIPEAADIEVRFRQGGERIQLNADGSHHALKKLFQQWGVPPWQRSRVPLLYVNGELAMVLGYALAHDFRSQPNHPGWQVSLVLD